MPITYIDIEWPDKEKDKIYSPSSVIKEYFKPGESMSIAHFLEACDTGLTEASERVRKKFGYACGSAQTESFRLNTKCTKYEASKKVKILSIN